MRGVTCARTSSKTSTAAASRTRAMRRLAPDAASGPVSPKCSASVVTTSSPGPSPRPVTTTCTACVVDSVSATCDGGTAICSASSARTRSRRSSIASKYGRPPRPFTASHARRSSIAATVARASGPNVPAFRYACRCSTGKRARSSGQVTRPPRRPAHGRRAGRRCARADRRASRYGADAVAPRTSTWSIPGPGLREPHSRPVRSCSVRERTYGTLKSPASTTTSSGRADETANHAARSNSASARRWSGG